MKYILVAAVAASFLTSCATPVTPEPVGGSRADGTVKLSFEFGIFQRPVVDWNGALDRARQSCSAWGYTGAERFGGGMQQCEAVNGYGQCMRMLVTYTYQCTGHP